MLLPWVLVPHSLQMEWERAWSCRRFCWWMVWSPQLPKAVEDVTETCFQQGLRVLTQGKNCTGLLGPTSAAVFASSMADQSRYSFKVCLCCQVSAQSSDWPLGKSFILCKLLSQGKKEVVCSRPVFYVIHPSIMWYWKLFSDHLLKNKVKVILMCTAALKLSTEKKTALPSCRGPSKWGLGQKSRL